MTFDSIFVPFCVWPELGIHYDWSRVDCEAAIGFCLVVEAIEIVAVCSMR